MRPNIWSIIWQWGELVIRGGGHQGGIINEQVLQQKDQSHINSSGLRMYWQTEQLDTPVSPRVTFQTSRAFVKGVLVWRNNKEDEEIEKELQNRKTPGPKFTNSPFNFTL